MNQRSAVQIIVKYLMLLAPFLIAFAFLLIIQQVEDPLRNAYTQGSTTPNSHVESMVRQRVSILTILEIFALTLIIRPWQFPWKVNRFLFAEAIFLIWGGVILALSMHMGALMAYHAMGMMVLVGGILPIVIIALFIRNMVSQ